MLILGICSGHDAGAALVRDGKILAAADEERFTGEKNYIGEPRKSIDSILEIAGVKGRDVSCISLPRVCYGKGSGTDFSSHDLRRILISRLSGLGTARILIGTESGVRIFRAALSNRFHRAKIKKQYAYLKEMGVNAPVFYFDHHLSHIASAYYTSGWGECLAVSLDAMGDGYCCRVATCKDGRIKIIKSIPAYHSPAHYYSYVTYLLGFKPGRDEGKVTGLAAYGDASKAVDIFKTRIDYSSAKISFVNSGRCYFSELAVLKRLLKGINKEDIAAGIQRHLEDMVISFIKAMVKLTQLKRIVLAGGVFSNIKLNQKIREIEGLEGVWIFPNMGDGGRAIGSALALWAMKEIKRGNEWKPERIKEVFWGPEFSAENIEDELKRNSLKYEKVKEIEEVLADYLAQGKIVARFSGRMEYGPRALGNRSILYQAKDNTVNNWLNKRLRRDNFMPFAPAVLKEFAQDYLQRYSREGPGAFMTITYNVTDRCLREAPGIVHIDKTARPQIVDRESNPSFYKILLAYWKKTGLPLLINTSFNIHEQPIVCTPYDAIRTFKAARLDILAIGNFIVKNGNGE